MTETKKGELFILVHSFISGFFPIIIILSLKNLPAMMSLSASLFLSTFFFLFLLLYKKKIKEILKIQAWPDIFAGAIIIGIILYSLYYFGLKFTSANNTSLISRTEVIFSFIFFHLIRKETIAKKHIWGIFSMLIGAVIILSPSSTGFNKGDFLILCAMAIAPLGNFFQRRARTKVSSETIMFFRSAIACLGVFLLSKFFNEHTTFSQIKNDFWFLAINGILAFGIQKICWLEGIHRISITKANALTIIGPLLTLIFAGLILHQPILPKQLFAFAPMALGLWLLTRERKIITNTI